MEFDILPDEILLYLFALLSSKSISNINLLSSVYYELLNKDLAWKIRVNQQLSSRTELPEDMENWKAYYQYIFFNLKPFENSDEAEKTYSFKDYNNALEENKLTPETAMNSLSTAVRYDADIWAHNLIKHDAKPNIDIIKSAIKNNAVYCIERFLKQNLIDLNQESSEIETPTYLHYAVHYATDKMVLAKMLDYAYANRSTLSILTRLHLSAATGNLKELENTLALTKDINERDKGYCTALWWALVCGQVECSQLLIKAGAALTTISINFTIAGGPAYPSHLNLHTALTTAIWSKNLACLRLVLQYQSIDINLEQLTHKFITPLKLLIKADFIEGFKYLANQIDTITYQKNGYTILHAVVQYDSLKILKFLLEKSKDIINHLFISDETYERGDRYIVTYSPLMYALFYRHLKAAKLLLESGADAAQLGRFICFDRNDSNKPCSDHFLIPLEELFKSKADLCDLGIENVVNLTKLLLDNVPLKQKRTDNKFNIFYTKNYLQGKAVMDWVRYSKDEYNLILETMTLKIIEILIQYGADINYTDEDGNTALSLAEEAKNEAIKQFILKHSKSKKISPSNYNTTFFSKPTPPESIFVHHYGIGRIDPDIDAKPKELYITGLGTFIGLVVIGQRKISLIHWDAEAAITPVYDEIKWVGENSKLIIVRDLSRGVVNDAKFANFIERVNHPNHEVIELYDKKYGGTVTVKSDKSFNTYPRKITAEQMTVRARAVFIKQFLNNFKYPEADLYYDGKSYSPFPALDDKSYAILNETLFKAYPKSITEVSFKAAVEVFTDVLCKKHGWGETPGYINEYFYCYVLHRDKQLKTLETCTLEGIQLYKDNKLAPAKIKFTMAIKLGGEFCKNDNPYFALALFNQATLYFKENNFSEALELYQRCLTIRQAIFKADDPKIKAVINAISQTENKLKEQQPNTSSLKLGCKP